MNDKKIITKFVFENEITGQDIELKFHKGMNIIIGSKGGGKSTLLTLIHYVHNKVKLPNDLIKLLKNYHLKIKYLEYSNGEKVYFENLENQWKTEFTDIVKQDDKTKNALSEEERIKKDKDEFIKAILDKHLKWLFWLINEYVGTLNDLWKLRDHYQLHWSLISHFNNKNEMLSNIKYQFINSREFDDHILAEKINMKALFDLYLYKLKRKNPEQYNLYKNMLDDLSKFHTEDLDLVANQKYFNLIYKKISNEVRNQLTQSSNILTNITTFKHDAKHMFEEIATILAHNKIIFTKLIDPSLCLNIDEYQKTHYDMEYTMNDQIYLNDIDENGDYDNAIMMQILEKILYKPKKKINHWVHWLSNNIAKQKNLISENKIKDSMRNILEKELYDHVKLIANGKDYNKMSLGTRTSFGIKQKIKRFKDNILFLDQPEDNLDNYTIFNELIKIFDEHKQFFMVTHNSNFGTLTNPQTITTCTLNENDPNNSYLQNFNILDEININVDNIINDSPVRHYLEGGMESLTTRYHKLNKKGEQ